MDGFRYRMGQRWRGLRFNRLDFDRHYVVDQVLSQKPRSSVLLVHRRGDQQQTIMKLSDPAAANPLEIHCLRSMRHPGIAGYLGHGLTRDHRIWIETEYIDGQLLSAWLDKRTSAKRHSQNRRATDIFLQLLSIVQYLHCCGWVHGDLTPQNILVAPGSRGVVLIDFEYVDSTATTNKKQMPRKHSINFASPHEVAGGATTESCEQFALGKLGLLLLAPFEDQTPGGVQAILTRASAMNSDDRYPSLQAVAKEMETSIRRNSSEFD
ncbi:MAG: protein kinase [Planctomycetota bacterium]